MPRVLVTSYLRLQMLGNQCQKIVNKQILWRRIPVRVFQILNNYNKPFSPYSDESESFLNSRTNSFWNKLIFLWEYTFFCIWNSRLVLVIRFYDWFTIYYSINAIKRNELKTSLRLNIIKPQWIERRSNTLIELNVSGP